jgi:hypothetical protein
VSLQAEIWLKDDELVRLTVRGHAGFGTRGGDPVCAALSALARSVARLLAASDRVKVVGSAAEAGSLEIEVVDVASGSHQWLLGVTDVLVRGLRDVAEEAGVSVIEHNENQRGRERYGT